LVFQIQNYEKVSNSFFRNEERSYRNKLLLVDRKMQLLQFLQLQTFLGCSLLHVSIRLCRFPLEMETYEVDQQFLLGGHVLLSPVLYPQKEDVEAYVPNARWFDYYTGVPRSL